MVWAMVWTGLVVAGLVLHLALARRVWRAAKAAFSEIGTASRRFSELSAAAKASFEERHPVTEPSPEAVLADPAALRRARDRRLRIARTRRKRRLAAVAPTGRGVRPSYDAPGSA